MPLFIFLIIPLDCVCCLKFSFSYSYSILRRISCFCRCLMGDILSDMLFFTVYLFKSLNYEVHSLFRQASEPCFYSALPNILLRKPKLLQLLLPVRKYPCRELLILLFPQ